MVRRTVFDTLRRGLDNAIVNWGLIVIRLVEVLVFAVLSVITALAIIVPVLVSLGIALNDIERPEDVESLLISLLDKWIWLIGILVAVSVLLLVFVAVHSFVEAGCARVAVDGDRAAGPAADGPRQRFRAFSMQRWAAGGKAGWWTVFWIYNFAWGVAGLILLIPLIPTAVIMFLTRAQTPVAIASGCIGLVLFVLLLIVVAVMTNAWTARAIADWAVEDKGASASLSGAWAAIKGDLGRHLLIALALIVIAMAGSSFFASFSWVAAFSEAFHRSTMTSVFTIPVRFLGMLLNWTFSGFVASWYLGAYGALAVETSSKAREGALSQM